MSEVTPRGTLGTVHNAASLLGLLSQGRSHHQLSDLADRSGMSLPTLHRLLRSLVAAGLVEQDRETSRYGLGAELVRLAQQYVVRLPVMKVAGPFLVDLRAATGVTVALVTLAGPDVVEVDRIDGHDVGGVYRDTSRVRPALETAGGRVLLAHEDPAWAAAVCVAPDGRPSDEERRRWAELATLTFVPPVPVARPEVAAPVRDGNGVTAALTITGPASDLTPDAIESQYAPQLLRAATSISRALGHG